MKYAYINYINVGFWYMIYTKNKNSGCRNIYLMLSELRLRDFS